MLPEDCWLLIFSHLSYKDLTKCALVCSKWNRLVKYLKQCYARSYKLGLSQDVSVPIHIRILKKYLLDHQIKKWFSLAICQICNENVSEQTTILQINNQLILQNESSLSIISSEDGCVRLIKGFKLPNNHEKLLRSITFPNIRYALYIFKRKLQWIVILEKDNSLLMIGYTSDEEKVNPIMKMNHITEKQCQIMMNMDITMC